MCNIQSGCYCYFSTTHTIPARRTAPNEFNLHVNTTVNSVYNVNINIVTDHGAQRNTYWRGEVFVKSYVLVKCFVAEMRDVQLIRFNV